MDANLEVIKREWGVVEYPDVVAFDDGSAVWLVSPETWEAQKKDIAAYDAGGDENDLLEYAYGVTDIEASWTSAVGGGVPVDVQLRLLRAYRQHFAAQAIGYSDQCALERIDEAIAELTERQ